MVETQTEKKKLFTLYGYWRSGASWRVRLALRLKNFDMDTEVDFKPVHLVKDGGEQHNEDYVKINPSHVSQPISHFSKLHIFRDLDTLLRMV